MSTGFNHGETHFAAEETTPRNPFERMRAEKPVFYCLREPDGFFSAQLWANLHYQMEWSVRTLEVQLAEEGKPHVLQLNAFNDLGGGQDWRNPTRWCLYADGRKVADGDGDQARRCFEEGAETFRDLCRESVEAASWSA